MLWWVACGLTIGLHSQLEVVFEWVDNFIAGKGDSRIFQQLPVESH